MSKYNNDDLGDSWTKKTVLDPVSGKFHNRYFYKRRRAHRIVINTPKAKALTGYMLIEKDLRSALIWLNEIESMLGDNKDFKDATGHKSMSFDRDKLNLVKGFFVAALTFYGKCFTRCDGRRAKLEMKNLDKEFHERHEAAMSFRHNYAAHSGAAQHEKANVVVTLDSKRARHTLPQVFRELLQPDAMLSTDFKELVSLFEHTHDFASNKIDILHNKIFEDDVVSKGPDYWYEKT